MYEAKKSAIIGMWRCGAIIEQICVVMNMKYWKVEEIINQYKYNQP